MTETGPITRKSETEGEEFLKALRALTAHSGGDCPELAFKGMLDALEEGPQTGSSMFVFTDASAKDAEKLDSVVEDALDEEIKINFFITSGCGSSDSLQPFRDVASKTGGRMYQLKTTADLKRLGQEVVSSCMQRPVSVSSGLGNSIGRRKRTTGKEYKISVDDSIERVTVSVTTQNSGRSVNIIDPTGRAVTKDRVDLTKGVAFTIDKPLTGVYKLIVPASAGTHTYEVNGASEMNIDFGHYYVAVAKRGTRIPVPLDQPLKGMNI